MKYVKRILRFLKRAADKTLGNITDEWYWRFRHLGEKKDWAEISLAPQNLEGAKNLLSHIVVYKPLKNALEVGCASGVNLIALAKQLPDTKLYGIDISTHAVRLGQKYLTPNHIRNISISAGRADNLGKFSDKSIDVVFTSAVLIYVGPNKIRAVLKEMLRVARKAIVLIEWNTVGESSVYADHWAHNWKSLLGELGENNVRLTKLDPDPWGGYGYLIEVVLG